MAEVYHIAKEQKVSNLEYIRVRKGRRPTVEKHYPTTVIIYCVPTLLLYYYWNEGSSWWE